MDAWAGPAPTKPQRRRNKQSFQALRQLKLDGKPVLGDRATVEDLARVNWLRLRDEWSASPSGWNHLRKAVSKFLSDVLADKWHSFRRQVIDHERFPKLEEVDRVPDLTPALFSKIVEAAAEHVRPAFVFLASTGIDVGPYLRMTRSHLHPNTRQIAVPDTKAAGRADTVSVDPRLWEWVDRAVPSPVQYKWLRLHWKRALQAAGADTALRLKDLRHCYGQWAVNEGVAESKVQVALRHRNPSMTRRYTKQRDRGEVAAAVADALLRKDEGVA